MHRAIELAKLGGRATAPNPQVGAVIVASSLGKAGTNAPAPLMQKSMHSAKQGRERAVQRCT
jgi:hypothetical protein